MIRKLMSVASVALLAGSLTMVASAFGDTTLSIDSVTNLGGGAGPFNVTSAGNLDWIVYGVNEKAGGTAITGTSYAGVNTDPSYPSFSYSDGAANETYGTANPGAQALYLINPTVSFDLPAGSGTITAWGGTGWSSTFTAAFADGTSRTYSLDAGVSNSWVDQAVISYHTDTAQKLSWYATTITGNSGVFAIAVSTVPEPGSLTIVGIGLFGLLAYAWRKRK